MLPQEAGCLSAVQVLTSHLTRFFYAFDGILSLCVWQCHAYPCLHNGFGVCAEPGFPSTVAAGSFYGISQN